MTPVRVLAVRIPDWPVVAWGVPPDEPAAVFVANRVVALSAAARGDGIANGMRRRQAQARCPELRVLERDHAREARSFEPLLVVLESFTPRVEVIRPGRCGFEIRGPARYFGGEQELCDAVHRRLRHEVNGEVRIGVAAGSFAADRAARLAFDGPLIVQTGATAEFLGRLPVMALGRPELADVLQRLGLDTLGAFTALTAGDVLARFGADGATAWRLARGDDVRLVYATAPPDDLSVRRDLDPPLERIETAAFVMSSLATEFVDRVSARGLACTRVIVAAETEHGERIERCWAHGTSTVAPLSPAGIAQRLRWQMEGWLSGLGEGGRGNTVHRTPVAHRLEGGICRLWLIPDQVVPATGQQAGLWGGTADATEHVLRALARVEGLLGPEAVRVPEWNGGRNPGEEWRLVPLGSVDWEHRRLSGEEPWPGRLPSPSPSVVQPSASPGRPVRMIDEQDRSVVVTGRGEISSAPVRLAVGDGPWRSVRHWAGPWPCEDRWWDAERARRRVRLQVVDEEGVARLVALENGQWTLEAVWD